MSKSSFKPAWWLPGPHFQTMWPVFCRKKVKARHLEIQHERIELPDGDFVDLAWCGQNGGPIIMILPGFEGSINHSHYAMGMVRSLCREKWCSVFMHYRGCSGEANRLPRGYHSGDTADIDYVVRTLNHRYPDIGIAMVGISLGGSLLLKWLGETGKHNPIKASVAVSVPFDLHKTADRMQRGFSRFYEWYLIKCARERLLKKFRQLPYLSIDSQVLAKIRKFRELDCYYTVPLHGFSSIDEYYTVSSSRQYLQGIQKPTLLLHSKDDPFMSEDVIPTRDELSQHVILELTQAGGHVGFVSGRLPWRPRYWLEERVPDFLKTYLK